VSRSTNVVCILAGILCLGCQGARLVKEGQDSRNAILDLYTEQAMDNLVRARCNMPFVQLAYHNVAVQDLDSASASVNDTIGDTQAVSRGVAGVLVSSLRTVGNSLVMGGMKSRSKTLSYSAEPVTDKNDIYLDYLAFAHNPGLLLESANEPKCGFHIKKQYNCKWYWVPEDAAPAFLDLVLKTSMMRGPDLLPSPYYDRKIIDVFETELPGNFLVEFDQPIPSGDGILKITVNNKAKQYNLQHFDSPVKIKDHTELIHEVSEGKPTLYLKVIRAFGDQTIDFKTLKGTTVQIFSDKFPPEAPKRSPELQQLQDSVNSLDLNLKNLVAPK
jgi:hypothetical protein